MDIGYLKLLVVAVVVAEGVWSVPLGCRDNGKSYREGEVVQGREPCLSCVCRRDALACRLKVCADYVEALPPGCILVHKPDDCCPQLYCEGGFGPNGIELRTGVKAEDKVEGNGCVINGTVYGEGSAVTSEDPCEYCYCTEGGVKCLKPRCVQSFEGCKAVYEKYSCCPTHFDCRDAKVSFLMPRVKHIGELRSKIPTDPLRSFAETNAELEEEDAGAGVTVAPLQEKTTEDLTVATTDETSTEETTPDDQPMTMTTTTTTMTMTMTTTPPSHDDLTTLGFQTSEVGNTATEETTTGVTTEALAETEKEEEEEEEGVSERSQGSEVKGADPVDAPEPLGIAWNSSQVAEDYDAYDYGEPKLPPSLPNLVIFPFVAADAVVKDDKPELYDEVKVDRIDDQPLLFKDYFSPPTRTEGGFVPKHPSSEPFYDLPFLINEPTERPTDAAAAPHRNAPLPSEPPDSSFELSPDDVRRRHGNSPAQSSPFDQVPPTEIASGSLRNTQQTNKPVTVAYKNVVVDFYPDHLVTTTRSRSTTRSQFLIPATDNTTAPVTFITPTYSLLGFFDEPPPTTTTTTITTTPTQSLLFDHFINSFFTTATPQPMLTTLPTNAKHKYSSKIKARTSTTANPLSTTTLQPGTQQSPHHPLTITTTTTTTTTTTIPNGGHKLHRDPHEGPTRIHSNSGATLLKLAGCNIYGMMYRIGKVIAELSGPCVECLCTDFGVQCSPLDC